MGKEEPRIYGTKAEEQKYVENFRAIDWGDRREKVMARIRAEKEGKR
jgi:hypothetical protein